MIMKPTKKELQNSIQLQINGAGGVFGPVVPVLDRVQTFNFEEVDGQIGNLGNDIYVCFHGSNSIRDWVDNLSFKKIPFFGYRMFINPMKVHMGFFRQYMVVRGYLISKILEYRKGGAEGKVIITGHSLGAATTTLASVDLQTSFPFIEILPIIFGSPRVGNHSFVNLFNKTFPDAYRFNYMNDMVAKLPTKFINYWHVGNMFELANIGEKYSYNLKHIWEAIFGNLEDHNLKLYKNRVDVLEWE